MFKSSFYAYIWRTLLFALSLGSTPLKGDAVLPSQGVKKNPNDAYTKNKAWFKVGLATFIAALHTWKVVLPKGMLLASIERSPFGSRVVVALLTFLIAYGIIARLSKKMKQLANHPLPENAILFLLSATLTWWFFGNALLFGEKIMNQKENGLFLLSLQKKSLFQPFLFSLTLNMVGFLVAYAFKSDKITDLFYALSFLGVIGHTAYTNQLENKKAWPLIVIALWALRLGIFLFSRIQKEGRDRRFDAMRTHFFRFGAFWLLQALAAPLILLPTLLMFYGNSPQNTSPNLYALILSLAGLLLETFADIEKYQFKANKKNQGKFIASGLWGIVQHPNYLGEILFWGGIYLSVYPLLGPLAPLGLSSPLMIAMLLCFVSGIPLLDKGAQAKWGHLPAFQRYRKKVEPLIPWFSPTDD